MKIDFFRRRKQSKLINLMLQYTASLLIVLTVLGILSYYSIKTTQKVCLDAKHYYINTIASDVDSLLREMERSYMDIFLSQPFNAIAGARERAPQTYYDIYELYNYLRALRTAASDIDTLMVYFPALDMIISDQAGMDYDNYKRIFFEGETSGLVKAINSNKPGFSIIDDRGLYYCANVISSDQIQDNPVIIIYSSQDRFKTCLQNYNEIGIRSIALQDRDQSFLMLLTDHIKEDEEYEELLINTEETDILGRDGLTVASAHSSINGWKYYCCMSASMFYEQLYKIRTVIIVCITITILLCVCGLIIMAFRAYRPIKGIVKKASVILPGAKSVSNELELLDSALEYMQNEQYNNERLIVQTQDNMVAYDFVRFLTGYGKPPCLSGLYQGEAYAIIMFTKDTENLENIIFQEFSEAKVLFLDFAESNAYLIIFNQIQNADNIENRYERIKEKINGQGHGIITPIVNNIEELYLVFSQAKWELAEEEVKGIYAANSLSAPHLTAQEVQELENAIINGHPEVVSKHLTRLFQEKTDKHLTQCLCYELLGIMAKIATTCTDISGRVMVSSTLERLSTGIREYNFEKTHEEFITLSNLLSKYAVIGNAYDSEKESNNMVSQAIDYIEQNITDPNLYQGQVASFCGISESSLSKLFRNYGLESVNTIITSKRISIAKELLRSTELTVDEIAQQIGMSGAKTLTRTFKKVENITPGAWREMMTSKKNV